MGVRTYHVSKIKVKGYIIYEYNVTVKSEGVSVRVLVNSCLLVISKKNLTGKQRNN